MIYKDFKGMKLSMLGFGTMRMPVIDGNDGRINEEQAFRMFDYAIEHGVNYFDTAYGYHAGRSEIVTGKALSRYPRESYYLATKFPGYDLSNMPKVKEIFADQLKKTGAGYFDFYLFHNVCEMNIDQYLDPKFGIYEHLTLQRDKGLIKHLGFSAHGEIDVLKRFLEAYGKDMEFCQLQLNYMDWKFQHGREKVELLREYGIPVWVMEPLRGGRLASLSPEQESILKGLRPDEIIPAWAFRFLQSVPEVNVILSGMSDEEQMRSNIAIFEEDRPLNEKEWDALTKITDELMSLGMVPCTACRYCTEHCPMSLDIPKLISLYNEHIFTTSGGQFGFIAPMMLSQFDEDKRPSACLHCESCQKVCPQQIRISEIMKDFAERL